jgi:hypothetical protein
MPEDELTAGPDGVYDINPEPDTVTWVMLVMVEVRTTLEVELPDAELDEPVMAPAVLLPGAEELLAYEDALGAADEEPEAEPLTGDDDELEPAGMTPLEDAEAGLEAGAEVEAGPLEDGDAGMEETPLDDADTELEAELDGTMLEDDELMVTVELRVRVMVLYTVLVDVVGAEELLPEAGLLSVLCEAPGVD